MFWWMFIRILGKTGPSLMSFGRCFKRKLLDESPRFEVRQWPFGSIWISPGHVQTQNNLKSPFWIDRYPSFAYLGPINSPWFALIDSKKSLLTQLRWEGWWLETLSGIFTPKMAEMIQIYEHIFSLNGWQKGHTNQEQMIFLTKLESIEIRSLKRGPFKGSLEYWRGMEIWIHQNHAKPSKRISMNSAPWFSIICGWHHLRENG